MPEQSTGVWEMAKRAVVLSPYFIGPLVGMTLVPNLDSGRYSSDTVAGISAEINGMDTAVERLIGPEEVCMRATYRRLRDDGKFPTEHGKAAEVLDASCPDEEPVSDQNARAIVSYVKDMQRLDEDIDEQRGLRHVTVAERLGGGVLGLGAGWITSAISRRLVERRRRKRAFARAHEVV